jgi:hypothetical protein
LRSNPFPEIGAKPFQGPAALIAAFGSDYKKPAPSGRKAAVSGQPLPLFWHCRCPQPGKPLKYGAVKTGTGFALSLSCKT